jgi:hypothetical protein
MAAHILNSNPKVKEVLTAGRQTIFPTSNLEKNGELQSRLSFLKRHGFDAQSSRKAKLATLADLAKTAKEKKKTLAKLEVS